MKDTRYVVVDKKSGYKKKSDRQVIAKVIKR